MSTPIAFVIAVKHPALSNNYKRTWRILNDTVYSLCCDSSARVIVVCDSSLPWFHSASRIDCCTTLVERDFGIPSTEKSITHGRDTNRGIKYITGILAAREIGAQYIMIVDADDFVSSDVSEYVKKSPSNHGWFVGTGFTLAGFHLTRLTKLDQACGSTRVMNMSILDRKIPNQLDTDSTVDDIVSSVDPAFLRYVLGGHQMTVKFFQEAGTPLTRLPFPGSIWHVATGDNMSGRKESPPGSRFIISETLRRQFNIFEYDDSDPSPGLDHGESLTWRAAGDGGDLSVSQKFNLETVPETELPELDKVLPESVGDYIKLYADLHGSAVDSVHHSAVAHLLHLRRSLQLTFDPDISAFT